MAGKKGRSGRKSRIWEFNAQCMLAQAAARIERVERTTKSDAIKDEFFSDLEVEKRKMALEVFKKLAPSNVQLGDPDGNALQMMTINIIHGYHGADEAKKPGN